ncbi:MAG: NusG domain II-containing protein [Lachnospiraceae bacterium]|nr:NusG domain II-containing protein [Lachnospiraceae bacterium]
MKTSDGNNTIKHDLILLAMFILNAAILFFIINRTDEIKGDYVLITLNNSEYARIPLNKDTVLSIDSDKGKNTVVVSDKEVYVESADCPDQICVDHAHIMYEGETIVCLPHRLIIKIVSEEGSETDAISQ